MKYTRFGYITRNMVRAGLWRDYQDHGTRGHVDMIAALHPMARLTPSAA